MTGLTNLEQAVFTALMEARPELAEQLKSFVASAQVSLRDNTGHGFYTDFVLQHDIPPIALPSPLSGPNVEVQAGGEVLAMGFLVWLDGGYPSTLEAFQYGREDGKDFDRKRRTCVNCAS